LNASLEGCRLFLEQWRSAFDVHFLVLPVEYGPDTVVVDAAVSELQPAVILHTGQASGAAAVRVERLAVNVRYAAGDLGQGRPAPEHGQELIEVGGPPGIFSTLNVERVAHAIRTEGVPAAVSNHAGIYLCNHVLYCSLRRAERAGSPERVGFLHVPALPEQAPAEPSLPAEQIAAAIHAAVSEASAGA
jgi:pyroglutamyl-peptidase